MVSTSGMKRAVVLLCAVATATLAVALALSVSEPAGAAADRLPDLGMAKLTNIQIKKCTDTTGDCAYAGQGQLRFDTKIVNIGAGALEAHGSRPDTSTPTMGVKQRIFDDGGGYRDVPTTARMYYAGDGHNHWHLKNLERYTLTRLDNGAKVGTGAKEGFCFVDNFNFGSTQPAFYGTSSSPYGRSCYNNQPDALNVAMGLSRGWGDKYSWDTVGQYIDVTSLTSGRYRLTARADRDSWFLESNESNNSTWVKVQLKGGGLSVLQYGPKAQRISG